jgi:hypothetical protein
MPSVPQVRENRTVPIEGFYNKTVYVTLAEKRKHDAAYYAWAGIAFVYVALSIQFAKSGIGIIRPK